MIGEFGLYLQLLNRGEDWQIGIQTLLKLIGHHVLVHFVERSRRF